MFTPSTKAEEGPRPEHPLRGRRRRCWASTSPQQARDDVARALLAGAPRSPPANGIIIADTKFELGFVDGELVVADEVMTPDSSRFWPADEWRPGEAPPSFDKQPVRDHLTRSTGTSNRRRRPLPPEVVASTSSSLRRGLRADHPPIVRRLARRRLSRHGPRPAPCDSMTPWLRSRCRWRSDTRPGSAIRPAPRSSGRCRRWVSAGSAGVTVGKSIRFRIDADGRRRRTRRGRGPLPAVPDQPGDRGLVDRRSSRRRWGWAE